MEDEYYNYFPISETPETVEGMTLDPFVVNETRDTGDTGDDYTPTEPGMWDDFWGPDSWDADEPGNFWDSLTTAFDAGASSALANVKKALTPAQAAAAGKPSAGTSGGGSSSSSSKPNQTTTTTSNTTNNFLTSPVAVIAMIFGGIYLLKIARK